MRLVHILLFCCLVNAEYREGDECSVSSGLRGIYKNINSCPCFKHWLQDIKICEYEEKNLLFCYIEINSHSTVEPGKLSAKKCEEYYPFKGYPIVGPGAMKSLVKEFPHMAIIGIEISGNIQWICGGSLISPKFVLTAAHCLRSKLIVRLGDLDLATDTDLAAPQQIQSKRVIPHPEYKILSRYHDIGLIELKRQVDLTEYVAIACLDTRRHRNETKMTATGWGKTDLFGDFSSHLLKVDIDVAAHNVCNASYRNDSNLPLGIIDDSQICAGSPVGDDTCQGDSGGPLQIMNEDKSSFIPVYDIVGVTSFGKACGQSTAPAVYTRVFNYLSWIESIVWPDS